MLWRPPSAFSWFYYEGSHYWNNSFLFLLDSLKGMDQDNPNLSLWRLSQQHRSHPPNSHHHHHLLLRIILRKRRKRQIRRLCDELLHLKVLPLHRIRIGPVTIGTLPEGTWRHLVPTEIQSILGTYDEWMFVIFYMTIDWFGMDRRIYTTTILYL